MAVAITRTDLSTEELRGAAHLDSDWRLNGRIAGGGTVSFRRSFVLFGIDFPRPLGAIINLDGVFQNGLFLGDFRADNNSRYGDVHDCYGSVVLAPEGSPAAAQLAAGRSVKDILSGNQTARVQPPPAPAGAGTNIADTASEAARAEGNARRLRAKLARLRDEAEARKRAERLADERRRREQAATQARQTTKGKKRGVDRTATLQTDLQNLKKLFDAGLITKQQYAAQQQALLDRRFGNGPGAALPAEEPVLAINVPRGINFGNYHALVIGINRYAALTPLTTAEADARSIAKLLEVNYGFRVKLLLNPKRNEIVDALDDLRATLKVTDNLLIYYAGHGWLDERADQGYWLPVDAQPNRRSKWVSNDTITDTMRAMEAKHVMVVADSCYSGRLVRGANVSLNSPKYYQNISRKKARVVITSGGLEPVADNSGSGHSPFTDALLKQLGANRGVLDGNTLFNAIRREVIVNADQTPQFSDVRKAGHDGGDFLVVRRR